MGPSSQRMDSSIAVIRQFLKTLATGDECFLIRFSDEPYLLRDFTGDPDDILKALSSIRANGWTALNDTIYLAIHQMKRAKNPHKAISALTDGGDNRSRYANSELRSFVQESDMRVYSIGLFERSGLLEKLGTESGGRTFWVRRLCDLPDVIDRLNREFRHEYVLGYAPNQRPNDGKYASARHHEARKHFTGPPRVEASLKPSLALRIGEADAPKALEGDELVEGVLALVQRLRPVHVLLLREEPLGRHREIGRLLPVLGRLGIEAQLMTGALLPIPQEFTIWDNLQIVAFRRRVPAGELRARSSEHFRTHRHGALRNRIPIRHAPKPPSRIYGFLVLAGGGERYLFHAFRHRQSGRTVDDGARTGVYPARML